MNNHAMEKTLSNLRKRCREHGIKVKKETLSWGPHLTFEIGGISTSSVIFKDHYEKHRSQYEAVQQIKEEFRGMTIDGQKVYGLGKD